MIKRYQLHRSRSWLRRSLIVIGVLLMLLIGLAIFIKFDTGAAAELTDRVLRPVLGPTRVVWLERIFFNLSDKVQQTTSKYQKQDNPLVDQGGNLSEANSSDNKLDLTPIPVINSFAPVDGEGIWHNRALNIFPGQTVMAYTFIRPDPARSFAFTTLIQIDMNLVRLSAVAGKNQPGGPVGKYGPGIIPKEVIQSGNLVAAFDGGFQFRDGEYGMIVGSTTYLPLKNDVGTLIGDTDGSLKIINYHGEHLGNKVAFVRQNCPILLENGQISTVDPKIKALWGRTITSDIYTWRSGLGVTANGNLIYAVGNNLIPTTLAEALKLAGAVNAIQLDINPYWVRFNIFQNNGPGKYTTSTLTKGLADGSKQYLNGYDKDFFYLVKK